MNAGIDKKQHSCPLCREREKPALVFKGIHDLYRCPKCRLIFSGRVSDGSLKDYYLKNENGFFERPYFTEAQGALPENPEYPGYSRALRALRRRLTAAPARLLDVGCGTGALLETAAEMGFQAEGIEVSESICAKAKNRFPIYFYDGDHRHLPKTGPYDAIVFWDVLEHVADPVGFLKAFHGLLKTDGWLLLRTINENCLLTQTAMSLYNLSGRRFKWPAQRMHEPYHVVYFTQETLLKCLKEAGYDKRDYWLGEFPVERASSSKAVRLGLKLAYFLQNLTHKNYEQYVLATKALTGSA